MVEDLESRVKKNKPNDDPFFKWCGHALVFGSVAAFYTTGNTSHLVAGAISGGLAYYLSQK